MGKREEGRRRTTSAILQAARRAIAAEGGGSLSMRAIAREVGLVSSAVYRYFPTREALLTTLIVESYGNLDHALGEVSDAATPPTWTALGHAVRAWALTAPHEFQLIYGTPIPGYVAPPETVPAAAAVAVHFLAVGAGATPPPFDTAELTRQLGPLAAAVPGGHPAGAAAVLTELAALVGFIGLELAGHFVGTADPADALYDALLRRQSATLAPLRTEQRKAAGQARPMATSTSGRRRTGGGDPATRLSAGRSRGVPVPGRSPADRGARPDPAG